MYIHKYLQHLLSNGQLNTQIIKVKSVILSGIPKEFENFKPLFQVFDRNGILYEEKNQIIQQNEQCIFILPNLQISNDIVFRCKHITQENDLIPIFRFQIHTGFLFKNIIRFNGNDLDFQQSFDDDIYIDMVYLRGNENNNIPDSDKLNCDQQSQEGYQMIKQLLHTCQMMSLNINLQLFQENVIFNQTQENLQQIQKFDQSEEAYEKNQRKNSKQEKENQQVGQNQIKKEETYEKVQDKDSNQKENENNDDDDEIII